MPAFVPAPPSATAQAQDAPVAVGAQSKHKFLMRLFIPGKGYKYIYPPGSSMARVPTAPPAAPSGQQQQNAPDPNQLTTAPPRPLPRRPGHAGRNFLGSAGVPTLTLPARDFWTHHHDDLVQAVILLIHEHCALANLGDVWNTLKGDLSAVGEAGARCVLRDQEKAQDIYRLARGVAPIAAHLLVVDNWQALCHGLDALTPRQQDHLASIARPRGGWPLFDDALSELSKRRYDIHD